MKKSNKINIRRGVFMLLTAALSVFIFVMSSQSGEQSSDTSGGFISFFCELLVPQFSGFDGERRQQVVEELQFIVRKGAHFSVYFLLAIFAKGFFATFRRLSGKFSSAAAAFGYCLVYAMSDELHQYFVDGRSAQLRDVLIDSCGALTGIAIATATAAAVAKAGKVDS